MSTVVSISQPVLPRPVHGPGWLRSPQRMGLRRAVFQVHLWLGLVLTVYAVVIGLSGAALVFRPEIERGLRPDLFHVGPALGELAMQRPTLAATIAATEAARPGWRVASVRDFDKPDEATTLLLRPMRGVLDANYRTVSVNPYTGAVLADRMRFAGVLGWLSNLHFYLLAGKTGLAVSGWMALGLLLLCLTGLVVWWPGVSRWRGAVLLRPHIRWRRLNWDLHSVVGFWFSASLLLLSFTGLYFAFPGPVARVVIAVAGGRAAEEPMPQSQPPAAQAGEHTLTVDEAIAAARQWLPAEAPPDYLALPSRPGAPFSATGYYAGTAPYSQLVSVTLDPVSGGERSRSDTRRQGRGQRWVQMFFALHFGTFGGSFGRSFEGESAVEWLVKAIWVLAGLSPGLLAVTGLVMYWNRTWRPWRARRRHRITRN